MGYLKVDEMRDELEINSFLDLSPLRRFCLQPDGDNQSGPTQAWLLSTSQTGSNQIAASNY
jgi:hypothetical protein